MSLRSAACRPLRHSRGKYKFAPVPYCGRRYDPFKHVSHRQPRRSRGQSKHLRAVFIELNRRGPWTAEEKKEYIRRIRQAVNRGISGFEALPQAKTNPPKFKLEPSPPLKAPAKSYEERLFGTPSIPDRSFVGFLCSRRPYGW